MATFHPLTVTGIRRETRDSIVLTLAPAEADRGTFHFTQGQYLTLRTRIDGEEVRRSYSICAAAQDGELRVGIKKIEGGLFSSWANERIVPGDAIEAMPPDGQLPPAARPDRRATTISASPPAAGSRRCSASSRPRSRPSR